MKQSFKKNTTKLKNTIGIPVQENNEPLVLLNQKIFKTKYKKNDMKKVLGNAMYVRKTVSEKLKIAQTKLMKKISPP